MGEKTYLLPVKGGESFVEGQGAVQPSQWQNLKGHSDLYEVTQRAALGSVCGRPSALPSEPLLQQPTADSSFLLGDSPSLPALFPVSFPSAGFD